MGDPLRDAMFIQQLKPIQPWLVDDEEWGVVTAERWGEKGWDLDGDAYWATRTHVSRLDAWSFPKPEAATHVAIYHK